MHAMNVGEMIAIERDISEFGQMFELERAVMNLHVI
jgi:hypothetical protein